MEMRLKIVFNRIRNLFDNIVEFIALKSEIKYLRKELEESRLKERPYIDKITKLKSENRILKILNTKNEKKIIEYQEELKHYKE